MHSTVPPRQLGTRVFDILEHQGRKMSWLAERTGFTDQYLYQIKMGLRPVTQTFIDKCLFAFDLPFEALFFAPVSSEIDNLSIEKVAG